jgi:hypothetical protein
MEFLLKDDHVRSLTIADEESQVIIPPPFPLK